MGAPSKNVRPLFWSRFFYYVREPCRMVVPRIFIALAVVVVILAPSRMFVGLHVRLDFAIVIFCSRGPVSVINGGAKRHTLGWGCRTANVGIDSRCVEAGSR